MLVVGFSASRSHLAWVNHDNMVLVAMLPRACMSPCLAVGGRDTVIDLYTLALLDECQLGGVYTASDLYMLVLHVARRESIYSWPPGHAGSPRPQ